MGYRLVPSTKSYRIDIGDNIVYLKNKLKRA